LSGKRVSGIVGISLGRTILAKERIQKLCEYIDKNRAKNYPIKNTMLENETDFIKNNYFKMLAVLLQQGDEVTGGQENLFKRLLEGVKTDYKLEDYMRQALEITVEEFIDFTAAYKESPLKYRFVLDGILLINAEKRNKDVYKLLASFCEALLLNKEEVNYLSEVGKSILELDVGAYAVAESKAVASIPAEIYSGYISLIPSDCICSNEELVIFHPTLEEDVTIDVLERMGENPAPNIRVLNVTVDLSEYSLVFRNRKKVVLDGCRFIGGDRSICFDECNKIEIRNCIFEKFTQRALDITSGIRLYIRNSRFLECIYLDSANYYKEVLGGVIYMGRGVAYLDMCIFQECGVQNHIPGTVHTAKNAIIACGGKYKVNGCKFIQCTSKSGKYIYDATMFPPNTEGINCTFENSAKFC